MMTIKPARISRGAIIAGQFRLERLLGQGGMSVVWAARELQSGRPIAVKLLGPEAMAKPHLRQRFAREARITSRIRSSHVAQIIADGATSAGVPFVAMELLEGESLAAHLAHVGRCSLVTAGAVIEQVCRALSSAHVVGLVHRDVKPANIFLTQRPNGELFVRLLDFGLAKELLFGAAGLRKSGELLGTADYISPEQLCSPESVSPAADIWSLGVVLYEMLTGRRPFEEDSFPLLALRIAEGSFLPPSRVCPDLPPAVDAVFSRALSTDPRHRYATAAELGTAFLRVVRTHCSDAVVRPDVLRVLQAYDERSQADYPAQDRVSVVSDGTQSSSLRERFVSLMLVGLCIAVVLTSWLAASTFDDEHSETSHDAAQERPVETTAAAAVSSPRADEAPPSASETLQPPLRAAVDAQILPPLAAVEPEVSLPVLVPPVAAPLIDAPSDAAPVSAPGAPPPPSAPVPRPPLRAAKTKRVDKPRIETSAPEQHISPPPLAAPVLTKESKYGF